MSIIEHWAVSLTVHFNGRLFILSDIASHRLCHLLCCRLNLEIWKMKTEYLLICTVDMTGGWKELYRGYDVSTVRLVLCSVDFVFHFLLMLHLWVSYIPEEYWIFAIFTSHYSMHKMMLHILQTPGTVNKFLILTKSYTTESFLN